MYKNQLTKAAQQKLKEKKIETSVLKKALTKCSQWDDKVSLNVFFWRMVFLFKYDCRCPIHATSNEAILSCRMNF